MKATGEKRGRAASEAAPEPLTRRQRRSDETRRKLLDAALAVMLERGYDGTSLGEITERADLGTGTLYLYFRDKRSLYEAMVRRELARMYKRWRQGEESLAHTTSKSAPDLAATIKRMFAVTLEVFTENRKTARLFLVDGPPVDNFLLKDIGPALGAFVGGDKLRGQLSASLAAGAALAACRWALEQPAEQTSAKFIDVVASYCADGLLSALADKRSILGKPTKRRTAAK